MSICVVLGAWCEQTNRNCGISFVKRDDLRVLVRSALVNSIHSPDILLFTLAFFCEKSLHFNGQIKSFKALPKTNNNRIMLIYIHIIYIRIQIENHAVSCKRIRSHRSRLAHGSNEFKFVAVLLLLRPRIELIECPKIRL